MSALWENLCSPHNEEMSNQHGKKNPSTKSFEYKIFKGNQKYLIHSFVERPGQFKSCGSTIFQRVKAGLSKS